LIKKASGKAPSILIILASMLMLQVAGCSDSGSVGGGLPGTGSQIVVDSIDISGTQVQPLPAFSGNLQFLSTGSLQDPLFGNLTATGLVKPTLPPLVEEFNFGTDMTLRLVFNTDVPYGDTLATQRYNIVELNEVFRGNAVRLNDKIEKSTGPVVGSFTVQNQDSVDIELSEDWVCSYRDFYIATGEDRQLMYSRNFFGLAVVPQNQAQVISINERASRFIVPEEILEDSEESERDTLNIGIFESAYTLDRSNTQPVDEGTSLLYSTFEQMLEFDFDFSLENLGTQNISRAELVIFRDNLALNQSLTQLGESAVRPPGGNLQLFLLDENELVASIGPNTLVATGIYEPEDEAYHFNLTDAVRTRFFSNIEPDQSFYIAFGQVNGTIRSTALFNSQAAPENRPKVIITSVNTENN
jgi:hypothetical protein